jgi:hypothetical protein
MMVLSDVILYTTWMMRTILMMLGLAAVSSCATLPLPDSFDESLLILPYKVERVFGDGESEITSVRLVLTSEASEEEYTVSLQPGISFKAVALSPGPYAVSEIYVDARRVERPGEKWEDRHDASQSFYIKERIVLLPPWDFLILTDSRGYRFFFSENTGETERNSKILSAIKKERRWLAWDGYQLVNFPSGNGTAENAATDSVEESP